MVRRGGLVQRIFGEKIPEKTTAKLGVTRTPTHKRESDKGTSILTRRWTDRQPHPNNMSKYEDLNKDSAVSTAITMLSGMIAGVGFHLEMPKGDEAPEGETHSQIVALSDYLEEIDMDGLSELMVRTAYEKGFCPSERLDDGNYKVLPPETFYIWRTVKGDIYKYTQNIGSKKVAEWKEGDGFEDILILYRMWSPSRPYGKALVEDIVTRVGARDQMAEDVPDVIHKQGYPFRVIEADTQEIGDSVYAQFTEKDPEEDVFIYPILENQMRIHTETLTPRIGFTDYVKHNDEMIAEGLMAPLPVWMKNATEASANVIMESVERLVESEQRKYARVFEKDIYEPQVGSPTPRHVWGPSETGLEDITLEGVAALYNGGRGAITFAQAQELLHELGVPIGEVETEPPAPDPAFDLPPNPMNPMQDQELYVIEENYSREKISLREALDEGKRIIELNVTHHRDESIRKLELSLGKRPDPISDASEEHFELLRNELFGKYRNRLLGIHVKR